MLLTSIFFMSLYSRILLHSVKCICQVILWNKLYYYYYVPIALLLRLPNLEGACKCLTSSYFGYLPDPSEGTDGVYEAGVFPTFNQTGLRSVGSAVASCKKPFRDNCPKVSWTGARKSNGKVLVSKPICPVISNVAIDPCTQNWYPLSYESKP